MKRRWKIWLTLLLCALTGCSSDNWSSGDRVLVAKFLYDTDLTPPRRWDVVVFKFPREPLKHGTPKNYIKRLLGLPGELLAILFGRIYRATTPVEVPPPEGMAAKDLWQHRHFETHRFTDPAGEQLWNKMQFEICRKPLGTLLAMRRIVYDNDFPARDLELTMPPRWAPADPGKWRKQEKNGFRNDGSLPEVDWLRYQHILRTPGIPPDEGGAPERQLITDFLAYNRFAVNGADPGGYTPGNWVGDLILECALKVEKAEGEFCMELSKGVDRFQACWNLRTGICTLYRIDANGQQQQLDSKATRVKAPGDYELRFANVDERLTVWVDNKLVFGDGVSYEPPRRALGDGKYEILRDKFDRNDLEPASVGVKGAAIRVDNLKLFRDTYYTNPTGSGGMTMYVQPGHYLCLGDNSPHSSDSRSWGHEDRPEDHIGGLVPEQLILGRALLVYWPPSRFGAIK
jgi:signal peptidase I